MLLLLQWCFGYYGVQRRSFLQGRGTLVCLCLFLMFFSSIEARLHVQQCRSSTTATVARDAFVVRRTRRYPTGLGENN